MGRDRGECAPRRLRGPLVDARHGTAGTATASERPPAFGRGGRRDRTFPRRFGEGTGALASIRPCAGVRRRTSRQRQHIRPDTGLPAGLSAPPERAVGLAWSLSGAARVRRSHPPGRPPLGSCTGIPGPRRRHRGGPRRSRRPRRRARQRRPPRRIGDARTARRPRLRDEDADAARIPRSRSAQDPDGDRSRRFGRGVVRRRRRSGIRRAHVRDQDGDRGTSTRTTGVGSRGRRNTGHLGAVPHRYDGRVV